MAPALRADAQTSAHDLELEFLQRAERVVAATVLSHVETAAAPALLVELIASLEREFQPSS